MKKNSLSATGLSLSQAQSVSNLCHQRALEIGRKLLTVNNYSKTVKVAGEALPLTVETGVKMPADVVDLIKEKASLHGCQAFLMENIKAKADGHVPQGAHNFRKGKTAFSAKPNVFCGFS